jgi:hypothetical protein
MPIDLRRRHLPHCSPITALIISTVLASFLGGCASGATTPIGEPKEVMTSAWGPFARQCVVTRVTNYVIAGRSGPSERTTSHETCTGFAATPAAGGAVQITASTNTVGQSSTPLVSRILRRPSGVSRPADRSDTGLLAQGSDSSGFAEAFASDIGVTRKQTIGSHETLSLPVRLQILSPIDGMLSCRPDGGGADHGRETLIFSCTLNEKIDNDRLSARIQLAGVEEIDVLTGVRLSSLLVGSVTGHDRADAQARWRPVDYHVWHRRTTEFE